jgi:hypothetical protein
LLQFCGILGQVRLQIKALSGVQIGIAAADQHAIALEGSPQTADQQPACRAHHHDHNEQNR